MVERVGDANGTLSHDRSAGARLYPYGSKHGAVGTVHSVDPCQKERPDPSDHHFGITDLGG